MSLLKHISAFNPLFSTTKTHKQSLFWENKYGGVYFNFPTERDNQNIIFFCSRNFQFKHLIQGININESFVKYPAGFDRQSKIYEFLNNNTEPQSIEFVFEGKNKFIENRKAKRDLNSVIETIRKPNSIYGYLYRYLTSKQNKKSVSSQINYFLNHFYLRMTANSFCRNQGIDLKSKINKEISQRILGNLGEQYENNSPIQIQKINNDIQLVKRKIKETQEQIDQRQKEADKILNWYKIGAIAITVVHVVSFGYMIFFIDWLGWDIIEPLTYTVGVIYTLMGIRFYRKYKINRSTQTIKDVITKATISPSKLINLKEAKSRLILHQQELNRLNARTRILKNRINFRTSLADSFSNYQNKSM